MKTVCVIQHVACESPGLLSEVLGARGVGIELIQPFKGDQIPRRLASHAGLVVMGGPMSVHEQDRYPYLSQEIRLLQDALNRRLPVLGVCLGSQLLAAALEAPVTRGRQKEIGWHAVTLSRAAAQDGLWRGLPESFNAFHWHGDVFELPRAAASLAWSNWTEHQAFRFGDAAYGLLFHLEVTARIIGRMTRTFRRELIDAGLNERALLDDVVEQLAPLQAIGRTVFARWAALVTGERETVLAQPVIRTKRVYEPATADDGSRFLVDRLWPRGVKRDTLQLDGWLKEVAPSNSLRHWFGHDPARWPEFRRRYIAELDEGQEALRRIHEAAARGPVTLLFSAADRQRNNAIVLAEYCRSAKRSSNRR